MLNEDLLSVWLQLSNVIDNQRLVTDLPFNEAMVCGLLAKAQASGVHLTASDLCLETRILKSQMNSILHSLEQKNMIYRQRSQQDLRRIELWLSPEGLERYTTSHQQVLTLVDRLIDIMGEDYIRTLVPMLTKVVTAFDSILKER